MTAFAQAFEHGLTALYGVMGESCTYKDKAGWNRSCTVIVDRNLSQYGEVASVQGKVAVVIVRRTEVPERPRREETFELEASCETLVVDSVITSDDFEHRVLCA